VSHPGDGIGYDAIERAAPAGVDDGDGTTPSVGEQNRNAIGRSNAEPSPGPIGYQRVSFAKAAGQFAGPMDRAGVDLAQGDQLRRGKPVSGAARAKPVVEPRELFQLSDAINVKLVLTESAPVS